MTRRFRIVTLSCYVTGMRRAFSCIAGLLLFGCASSPAIGPGTPLPRHGDEIVVCGQLFHTGTPVILWMDPGGYDAYRVERRFGDFTESSWQATTRQSSDIVSPNRYGLRKGLTADQIELVRGGGWPLPLLRQKVDQFVIHYDASGVSRQCFYILHDHRGLSVHFMLDLDGTIYQTLDLKERAWHATTSNDRSIGIEIANIGVFPPGWHGPREQWYIRDADGRTRIELPKWLGNDGGLRTGGFIAHPIRDEPVIGQIQGQTLEQYDLTPQQYQALIRLTATLCAIFPAIACDAPRDGNGKVIDHKLPDDELAAWHGLLGHYHIQADKLDPGPAFQWDRVIDGARQLMVEKYTEH